jgi:methylaspartate ammonia-lyase
MILKGVDVLPHGLFNSVELVGREGERLREYLAWLKGRIQALGGPGYLQTVHVDVYGTLGIAFEARTDRLLDYLLVLEGLLAPFPLNVESPVDAGGREAQIEALAEITEGLMARGSRVRIVADEWCNIGEDIRAFAEAKACHMVQVKTPDLGGIQNSVEALLLCRELGVAPYLGGSCTDTDHSARVAVHIALATRPEQVLAKPGMGVDEGLMIVKNEMARTQALVRRSRSSQVGPRGAEGRTRA